MAIGRIPEPGTGIPESIVDAKGDIVTATAADTPARLAVGTNEQRLVADSAAATGLKYVSDTTNYAVAAKGDLLVGTAADTVAVLSVGTNGHTLVADSSVSPTGLKWAAPASGGMTLISTTTMSGASVTLSSIPQDYVSLLLVGRFFTNSTADGVLRINPNGDGGIARISGVISSGTFSSTTNILQLPANYDRTNDDNSFQLQIFNYQDTANYTMPFIWSGNFYAGAVGLMAGGILTANAGPITSLVISNTGGNWAGGTLKFYGVK